MAPDVAVAARGSPELYDISGDGVGGESVRSPSQLAYKAAEVVPGAKADLQKVEVQKAVLTIDGHVEIDTQHRAADMQTEEVQKAVFTIDGMGRFFAVLQGLEHIFEIWAHE